MKMPHVFPVLSRQRRFTGLFQSPVAIWALNRCLGRTRALHTHVLFFVLNKSASVDFSSIQH